MQWSRKGSPNYLVIRINKFFTIFEAVYKLRNNFRSQLLVGSSSLQNLNDDLYHFFLNQLKLGF